jgi:hypothetical protein
LIFYSETICSETICSEACICSRRECQSGRECQILAVLVNESESLKGFLAALGGQKAARLSSRRALTASSILAFSWRDEEPSCTGRPSGFALYGISTVGAF